ncbi:hypothetical protein GCM10009758_33180 [Microbacterium hatanonis]
MTTVAPALRSFAALRWSEVEPGFHVGERDGEFVGYVDTNADGTFVAFDGHSTAVGRFRSLAEAKASLLTTDHPANVRRDRLTRRVALGVATGVGAVAAGLALTAGVLAPFL